MAAPRPVILVLCAWVLAQAAPVLHRDSLALDAEACGDCRPDGPVVTALCSESADCGTPGHHHHRTATHEWRRCATCQGAIERLGLAKAAPIAAAPAAPGVRAVHSDHLPPLVLIPAAAAPRGPPSLSA